MNYKSLLIILFFFSCSLTASADFNFNDRCIEAYKAILDYRLNDARALIRDEKQQDPQNGITILLDNYIDYVSLFTSENKADYEKLKDNKSDRIDLLKKNDENSPYYLFSQAEIYFRWGEIKGSFGDYMSSASDLKKARNLLKENAEKYPDFLPDQKDLALINIVFGVVPSSLKGVLNFLGLEGDLQGGITQLEKLRSQIRGTKYSIYNDEIIFSLCLMNTDAMRTGSNSYHKLLSYLDSMDNKNTLKDYLSGYIYAVVAYNDDDAIVNLQAIPTSGEYINIPYADYLLACAKFCRMDADADTYFLKYINEYKGVNYIKDAYLKLAYFYLLKNDEVKYQYYLKLVRTKGYTNCERDKLALREANDTRPDIDLLKARMYFDGGYYNKALTQLKDKQDNDFNLLRDKIEFDYRLGRIYEKLNRFNDAVASYQKAINLGSATTYYFAASAALYTGEIYEYIKDDNQADNFYNQAINMKSHDDESTITNDAKNGLARIHR